MVLGKLNIHQQKDKIQPLSYNTHKKQHKWIKYRKEIPEAVKLLQENIGKILPDISHGNEFLKKTAKAQATKVKQTRGIALSSV